MQLEKTHITISYTEIGTGVIGKQGECVCCFAVAEGIEFVSLGTLKIAL